MVLLLGGGHNGVSPRHIARKLNDENIPGPGGRQWSDTTIRGQASRGTGLLYNELYVGRLVWNRCTYIKNPRTGKRIIRPNPSEQWESVEVPDLRIIDDDLWNKVKKRQKNARIEMARDESGNALNRVHRRKFMFSGLLKCGICGASYTIMGKDRYGCATHRSKGTCSNTRTIKRQVIEERILSGLRNRLMAPELVSTFIEEFIAEINRQNSEVELNRKSMKHELAQITRKIDAIIKAIEDGMYAPSMKSRLMELENRKEELDLAFKSPPPSPIRIHPNVHKIYEKRYRP